METEVETVGASDYKDRRTGLIAFGIIEIILGVLFAIIFISTTLITLFMPFSQQNSSTAMNSNVMIAGTLFYVALSVAFIWLGIGSIKAKRWARTLWLIGSWVGLIGGIMGMVWMAIVMFNMGSISNPEVPKLMITIITCISLGFMFIFYVVIPASLIFFYSSKHTKATCEHRDPNIRWTDKCPTPVLALSLMCWYGAVTVFFVGFTGWTVPFFGQILSGTSGAIAVIISSAILVYTAWTSYRLKIVAWWTTLIMILFWGTNAVTFSIVDLMEFYEKMNYTGQQLDAMEQLNLPAKPLMVSACIVGIVVSIAFIIFIKKYFTSETRQKYISNETDGSS